MAGLMRLELTTLAVTVPRSDQTELQPHKNGGECGYRPHLNFCVQDRRPRYAVPFPIKNGAPTWTRTKKNALQVRHYSQFNYGGDLIFLFIS